jgi:hypothetical protein
MARPAWIQHASGAALLMQWRGARQCYESAFEYSMFLACRGGIVGFAPLFVVAYLRLLLTIF